MNFNFKKGYLVKTICIKSVSKEKIEFLIKQFELLPINICMSNYRFKTYDNLLIHYLEKDYVDEFYEIVDV